MSRDDASVPRVVVVGEHNYEGFRVLSRLDYRGDIQVTVIPAGSELVLEDVIGAADALISRPARAGHVSAAMLAHARPGLIIVSPSRGIDHIQSRDFRIIYLSDDNSEALRLARESVVTLTVTLAEMLRRRLLPAILGVRGGSWTNVVCDTSTDLDDLTWWAFGSGGQVRHLIPRLLSQHVSRCFVYNPRLTPHKFAACLQRLDPNAWAATGDLAAACRTVDGRDMEVIGTTRLADITAANVNIVSLHVPAVGDSPIIDRALVDNLPPGTCVINPSRGQLVDEPAIAAAVRSSHILYAADVVNPLAETTGDPSFSELWQLSMSDTHGTLPLILTPHIGANTGPVLDAASLEVVKLLLVELGIRMEVVH